MQPSLFVLDKVCLGCLRQLPEEAFAHNSRRHDGLHRLCRDCSSAYLRNWRADNPQDLAARRAWRERTKDRARENHAKWYRENRDERLEVSRRWREENPERATATMRAQGYRRRLGYDQDAADYAAILLADPCSYCGRPSEHVDHIVPSSGGGPNEWQNLTGACESCNLSKHAHPLLHFLRTRVREKQH